MNILKKVLSAACAFSLFMICFPGGTQATNISAPSYGAITGTVSEVSPRYDNDGNPIEGAYLVSLTYGQSNQANFVVTSDTVFVTEREIKAGDTFTGYYDARRPMIMIYPPQYQAVAVAVNLNAATGFHVAAFDASLRSDDGLLQLEFADDSKLYHTDGTPFTDTPGGNEMVVLYHPAMDSSPQIGRVISAVILDKASATPPAPPSAEEVASAKISVNGTVIDAPTLYLAANGEIMVPLRAVAEALGYTVSWNNESRSIVVEGGQDATKISMTIGYEYYKDAQTTPITLSTASEISTESHRTYVPVSFFTQVMTLDQAAFIDGQLTIQAN